MDRVFVHSLSRKRERYNYFLSLPSRLTQSKNLLRYLSIGLGLFHGQHTDGITIDEFVTWETG